MKKRIVTIALLIVMIIGSFATMSMAMPNFNPGSEGKDGSDPGRPWYEQDKFRNVVAGSFRDLDSKEQMYLVVAGVSKEIKEVLATACEK